MSKMYYTAEEAAAKLGVSAEELEQMVRDEQLRVFKDGQRNMYMATEVDAQAPPTAQGEEEEVELTPAAAPAGEAGGSEDFTITSQGISIFDEEDLEIESADPSAKTQIAPSIEDQIAVEGVGSGSGLLDLTRESDDTSLGAEVLDHIDLEGEAAAAPAVAAGGSVMGLGPEVVETVISTPPTYVEAIDAGAGLFGGIIVAAAIVAALIGAVAFSAYSTSQIGYIFQLKENVLMVLGACFVVALIAAVLGWLFGKASAARQSALRRMGG